MGPASYVMPGTKPHGGLTGRRCPAGEFWGPVVRQCMPCDLICQQPDMTSSCNDYCVSARCRAKSAHYYDGLLKKCLSCADVCGRHPAECSPHCPISRHTPDSGGTWAPTTSEDATMVLYSLLLLSVVLLLSSLVLALVVLLMGGGRKRAHKPRAKEGAVQNGQGVNHPGQNSKQFAQDPDDANPTETCACVHCFPDPKGPDQSHSWLQRDLFSVYNEAVVQRAPFQTQSSIRTQEGMHTSALTAQEAVG